jgi:hypothetical protein
MITLVWSAALDSSAALQCIKRFFVFAVTMDRPVP